MTTFGPIYVGDCCYCGSSSSSSSSSSGCAFYCTDAIHNASWVVDSAPLSNLCPGTWPATFTLTPGTNPNGSGNCYWQSNVYTCPGASDYQFFMGYDPTTCLWSLSLFQDATASTIWLGYQGSASPDGAAFYSTVGLFGVHYLTVSPA